MDFDVWDNDNSILFLVFLPATHPPGPMKKKKEFVVVQSLSCPTLCDPVDCSKPDSCPSLSSGVCSDSCPLWWWCYHILCHLFFFFPLLAFSLFQHQSLFQWVGSLHEVAKVLDLQLQHQSFQWIVVQSLPLHCSMPGSSVLYYLLNHVHWVGDAI